MEPQPNFVLRLSLTEIALRRVVVNLCNETDILNSILKIQTKGRCSDRQRRNAWREIIQEKVRVKVSTLLLPEELKIKIMHVVKPIGVEILSWKTFHEKYFSDPSEEFDVSVLKRFYWTSAGTIEYQKTAEELIRCKMLDIVSRYKLACLYCLEDCIQILWKELPGNVQNYFYDQVCTSHMRQPYFYFFWPYLLKGEESKLIEMPGVCNGNYATFHQYAFEYSSFIGNKAATEYFYHKLTIEEREASLFRATIAVLPLFDVSPHHARPWVYGTNERFPRGKVTDTLCYLLSLIQQEPHMLEQLFREYTFSVLLFFLEWPWQDLLFEIADSIWHFLSPTNYVKLLGTLANGFKKLEYYFPKIFRQFFLRCPANFFKNHEDLNFLYPLFSSVLDPETLKAIFKNVDSTGRLNLVSSEMFFEVFYGRDRADTKYGVEMWLREARLSQEDGKVVKKAFIKFLERTTGRRIQDDNPHLDEFSELLDKSILRKRSIEEGTDEAKKLCSKVEELTNIVS